MSQDLWDIVREAYSLGYRDRDAQRDHDPGKALDLLYDYVIPSVPSGAEHSHETGGAWHLVGWQVPGCPACQSLADQRSAANQ